MRGRMNDAKSYAKPQEVGATMIGGTVGEVVATNHPGFAVGNHVRGMLGWSEVGVADGKDLTLIDTRQIPISAYLGVVGMTGMTAWYGYHKIIAPKAGETIVVSAASGCRRQRRWPARQARRVRAVGIAGGPDKCRYVTAELGFDACVDYRQAKDVKELAKLLGKPPPTGWTHISRMSAAMF